MWTVIARTDHAPDGFLDSVLDPKRSPSLGVVVPPLHPSYQTVWLARLGDDRAGSVAAIRAAIGRL